MILLLTTGLASRDQPALRAAGILAARKSWHYTCDVEHSGFTKLMQFYGSELCAWELVMADPTESKCRAEECRQLASIEPDEDDQAVWLRMADEWERLANLPIRPKENASPRQNLELQ
jgi:hypothetical protein